MGALLLRSSPFGALTIRMRRVARLRKPRSASADFPHLSRGFGHGRLKDYGARSIVRASVFGQRIRSSASRGSVPPNKSFKPTPCRGGGHVLYATLAHVRRPATGRLNSGVRRLKTLCSCLVRNCSSYASVCSALRTVSRRVATSVTSQGALTYRMRCVHRLRKLRFLSSSLPSPHAVTSESPS